MKFNKIACWLAAAAFITFITSVRATERFVSVDGSDANDGLSRETAFATVQKGVDALEPGDVLTIGPGEYREAVSRDNLGDMTIDTVIRAEIPGTVLLRGDVPAPEFKPVDRYRHVHKATFDHPVQAVNELDTLQILQFLPSVADVEFNPGSFHYDADARTLYISASDMRSPSDHRYTVSVIESRGGLFLKWPKRVVVEGLAVTGFHSNRALSRMSGGDTFSDIIPWGVYIWLGQDSVVRGVVTYLNAGGVGIISRNRGGNVVENCVSYGNYSQFSVGTGNICGKRVNNDAFLGNYAYVGRQHGIRFHSGSKSNNRMERNLSWGQGGNEIQVKGVANYDLSHCVALGSMVGRSQCSLMGKGKGEGSASDIVLGGDIDADQEFADPVNLDYRLQSTSRFRGSGPDGADQGPFPYQKTVFYVSPNGDDGADGLSISSAWATLAKSIDRIGPGDTLYLAEGDYAGDLTIAIRADDPANPVSIRSRGEGRARVLGKVLIENSANVDFERLDFLGGVSARNDDAVRFNNCRFRGAKASLRAEKVNGLRATHCEFTGMKGPALELSVCSKVFLQGNIYDTGDAPAIRLDALEEILYSDNNSYVPGGDAWTVAGKRWNLDRLRNAQFARHSSVKTPKYVEDEGRLELANPEDFILGAPLGTRLGVYRERLLYGGERTLRVNGPTLHSVTATTANIEWWSSHPAVFRVHWGPTAEMKNSETLTPDNAYHPSNSLENFNTFSLNGLEPGTEYRVRIEFVGFVEGISVADTSSIGELTLSFKTKDTDPSPRTLHVAKDGDDDASGLSRETAWRTINRATDAARPGDTILIGEGVYTEQVRVRVTGDEAKRITFKAQPGEKVVLDGHGQTLPGAFWLFNNKDYIDIDGFYLTDFMRQQRAKFGAIAVLRSDHLRLTRLFHHKSKPEIVTIASSNDVLVKNCVTMDGWDGVAAGESTNVRIENNVIVRPKIRSIPVSGKMPPRDVLVRNNIITDNIRKKMGANLVPNAKTLENNCFFLRAPETERSVFGGRAEGLKMAKYNRERGVSKPNLIANPRFAALQGDDKAESSQFFADWMPGKFNDFNDLFTTNPELIERGIGLQPAAFADFHFNQKP